MTTEAQEPLRIFCSYSHNDEKHLNDLREWLRGLERQGLIEWWHDREITPGWEWEEAIDKSLGAADIILFLVTSDFMASDYVYEKEIGRALDRHDRDEVRAIPIIVRPALWKRTPFGRLQALPKDAKPITTWPNQDEAWLDVAEGIQRAVEKLWVERQQRAAAKERYRKAVEEAWANNYLSDADTRQLDFLVSSLGLRGDTVAEIERLVMGDTKQAILERQELAAKEQEREERLKSLYDQAHELYQKQEWQAVVDVFAQIHREDPTYPDDDGLLTSAHEALQIAKKRAEALSQYRKGVESAWADEKLDGGEVETLRDLAANLQLGSNQTGQIEREVIGDTKEAILEDQKRTARERYHKAVKEAWADNHLSDADVERLGALASELNLSTGTAADIERDIMDTTKEATLEYQEQVSREKERQDRERQDRLDELHDRARRSRQKEDWQAVVDVFEEIRAEESDYPDHEGLLASAREALEAQELTHRVAAVYAEGQRHMDAREWQLALECFEDVQRLNPEYRDTEEQLARVRRELAAPQMVEVPDLLGQRVSEARSRLASKGLKLGVYEEVPSDTIAEGEIIQQSPERGTKMLVFSSVIITVSSGPHEAISTAPTGGQTGAYTNRIERVQHVLPASAGSRWALGLRGLAMGTFGLWLLLFSNDASGGPFQMYSSLLVIADALFATIDAKTGFGRRRLLFTQGWIGGLVGLAILLVWLGGYTLIIIPDEGVQENVKIFIQEWNIGTTLVGSWAIFVGIIRTVAAVKLRWDTKNLLLMGTSGMLLVLSGILLWAASSDLWWLVGFLMLTSAIVLIAVVVRVWGQEGWGSRAR
jgi:hypothetical protein